MNNENGSTLVIGILVLAAVVSSSVVLAGVIVRNFQTTSDLDESFAAYYAAETGIEMGLYQFYSGGQMFTTLDGSVGDGDEVWTLAYENMVDEIVSANGVSAGETAQIDLYSINGEGVDESLGDAIVSVEWDVNFSLRNAFIEWSLYSWGAEDDISFDSREIDIEKSVTDVGVVCRGSGCREQEFYLEDGKKYILRFKVFCTGGGDVSAAACALSNYQVYATREGLPVDLPGSPSLTSTGTSADDDYQRSITIYLPEGEKAFPVFDYSIFSEGAIRMD